jgi:hypothetical protein
MAPVGGRGNDYDGGYTPWREKDYPHPLRVPGHGLYICARCERRGEARSYVFDRVLRRYVCKAPKACTKRLRQLERARYGETVV